MTDFGCRAKLFLRFFDEIANQTGHNIAKSAYLPRERLRKNKPNVKMGKLLQYQQYKEFMEIFVILSRFCQENQTQFMLASSTAAGLIKQGSVTA